MSVLISKNPWRVVILVLMLVIGSLITVPAAARYPSPEGSNAGVDPGDRVFIGERGLNFSTFQTTPQLLPTLWLACDDGGSARELQDLDDGAVLIGRLDNIGSQYLNMPFKLYNGSWGNSICTVSQPTGSIEVRTGTALGTEVDPAVTDTKTPAVIPLNMNVQFKIDSTNLNGGKFVSPWYEYRLKGPGSQVRDGITNMYGDFVPLSSLMTDPTADNNTLAFKIANQNFNPEEGSYEMEFTAYNGRNSFYTVDYEFEVVRYTLSASAEPSTVHMGDSTTLTIIGKPYTYYTISIEDAMDGKPELPATGNNYDNYTNKYKATVHPGWSGTVSVRLDIPEVAGDYSRTTRMFYPRVYETNNPSTDTNAQIIVEPGTSQDITLYDLPLSNDEYYCLGDTIPVEGTLGNAAVDDMNVYFYITGYNLNSNGVKPSNPSVVVVDGDNSTFDSVQISEGQQDFEYKWDTSGTGLAPGTYTLFATTDPIGYGSRGLAEEEVKDYLAIDLNEPSINVKFPEEAPGFFAQGDHIVSLWSARGSPAKMSYTGTIRYYILGTNFKYTGYREFPLLKVDSGGTGVEQLSELAEKNDFPGYSGLNLPRSFSDNMSEGRFYVLYQHPMNNQVFDVLPVEGNTYSGTITTLQTTDGKLIDIASLQANTALNAIMNSIDSPYIDDTMVSQKFVIERPWVYIDPIHNYEVGETIPVIGSTNLECPISYPYNQIDLSGDFINFAVYEAGMYYSGKTQSTNRIYSSSAYPEKTSIGVDSRVISLSIPADISAKMEPGDYVGFIKCEDIKYEKAFLFTLHEEGYRKENGIAAPSIGEEFTNLPEPTQDTTLVFPTGTPRSTRSSTVQPTEVTETKPNSTGFGPLFYIIAVIFVSYALLHSVRKVR